MTLPNPAPVLDLIDAFRRSKIMFTASAFGIFDRLVEGPQTAEQLAAETGTNAGALARLLEACAALGLLFHRAGSFENTPLAAAYLAGSSPHSLAGYIRYSDQALYPLWAHLDDAVRENSNRWQQTFPSNSESIFDHFFRSDEAMRTFLQGMHGFGCLSSPAIVEAFDLSRFRRLVDLGGGTGHLAATACERYPGMQATIFDLPRVISFTREMIANSPARDRLDVRSGDFFVDPLPAADLYCVSRILHDWAEPKIDALLARVAAILAPGGGLLIAETLFEDDHSGPPAAHWQSMNMLVCTEGRERSFAEYRILLERAGFRDIQCRRTGQPLDAILACVDDEHAD